MKLDFERLSTVEGVCPTNLLKLRSLPEKLQDTRNNDKVQPKRMHTAQIISNKTLIG